MNAAQEALKRRAEFLSDIRALDVSEGRVTREFELMEDFVFYSETLNDVVRVPKGFRFDGESIPTCLHWLVPPFGQSKRGAAAHDYLYQLAGYYRETPDAAPEFVAVTRAVADQVYYELTMLKGLPKWRAKMRYTVLRLVGRSAWNSHRRKERRQHGDSPNVSTQE